MTDREAQQLIRTVEETWRIDFGGEGRRIWRESLMRYEYDEAHAAVVRLAERHRDRPTIADVRAMIRSLATIQAPQLPEGKPTDIPEWVLVWRFGRFLREPPFAFPLPQQHPHLQPPYATTEDYDRLREEWVAAGRPGRGLAATQVLGV